jgi:pyruvate formate lyase activating enzyme
MPEPEKTLLICNLQRFSLRDGPGIRTTAFLKGCNLRCHWCHNPETLDSRIEVQFLADKCVRCGKCMGICERFTGETQGPDRTKPCRRCGKCAAVCMFGALTMCGKTYSVPELCRELSKDKFFFDVSGGGITLSGGEPLLQESVPAILHALNKNGIHCALDTAFNVPWSNIDKTIPWTNLYLIDIKAIDPEIHKRYTGQSNVLILENIKKIVKTDKEIWFRTPVIPGANEQELPKIAEFLRGINSKRIHCELIPFHNFAVNKYRTLGLEYKYADALPPGEDLMEKHRNLFRGINHIDYAKEDLNGCVL